MKFFVLSILAIPLALSCIAAKADKVDDFVKTQMRTKHIPGLAIAIVRDGKIMKLKEYGHANLEWDARVGPDTAFQLASATKPFTGTALMLLVEDGKIALDDKITKYLPDGPAFWANVTIRNLATHTSGLKEVEGPMNPSWSVDDAVRAIAALPHSYTPGEKAIYGGSDYAVLMRIMEKVTGKPFEEFLRERLFAPLGMTSTRFDNDGKEEHRKADLIHHRASIYYWENDTQRVDLFLYPTYTYSAGGLFSSITDLAKWVVALDTGKLLRKSSLEQMWSGQKLNDGTEGEFGLGWIVETYKGHKVVGHSGGPALADIKHFVDEKLTIVVLTNQRVQNPELARSIADVLNESEVRLQKNHQ